MAQIAKLGDPSDHGGVIITASGGFTMDGTGGVVDGDLHQCPIKGHGITPITSNSSAKGLGKGIVRTGDKAGCGAAIIASGTGTAE